MEYRIEGFDMFDQMVDSIRESSVKMLLTIEVREAGAAPSVSRWPNPPARAMCLANGAPGAKVRPRASLSASSRSAATTLPCGSGLKWKKCTCAQYHPMVPTAGAVIFAAAHNMSLNSLWKIPFNRLCTQDKKGS